MLLQALVLMVFSQVILAQPYVSDGVAKWITDKDSGCSSRNPNPKVGEVITWSGTCKNGLIDGVGRLEWRINGELTEVSEGNFDLGSQHGFGSREWPNTGGKYIGDVERGKFQGNGKYIFKNGDFYQGQFHNGKFNGSGTLYSLSGKVLRVGHWKDGRFLDKNAANIESSSNVSKKDVDNSAATVKCKKLGLLVNTKDFELCLRSMTK